MKKILLVFLIVSFIVSDSSSQCVNKGITTNPSNPINTELPSKRNIYFDWTQQYYSNNTSCQLSSSVESPFYKVDNLEALRASKDMLPIDGWELIRRDFGYYDDNTIKPEAPEHAYLILYNKFTGVLRILLKTCRGLDYNGSKITLKFDATSSFQTALLSLTDATAEGLSVTHVPDPAAQSVAVYTNDNTKWFYADFPMAYDPCTCYNSSKLNIISNLIQSSSITLEGTTTGTLTTITNGTGSVNNDGKYTFKDFVTGVEKFQKGYTSVDNFITQSKAITNTLFGANSSQTTALTNFQAALKSNSFLNTGLAAAAPWLKTAVGILDLFTGGGKSSPQPVQIMPMAVSLTSKLNGTITTANQYHNIIFSTPGSLNASADPSIYPTYNEVLGVFNLLNSPTFINNWSPTTSGPWISGSRNGFRLKEPIKWVVNPASRLVLQDALVAYVAIPQVPTLAGEPNTLPLNFVENGFNFSEGKDAVTGKWQYRTEYVNINCLGNDHNFYFYYPISPQGGIPKFFMKFILNFKKIDDPNGQNVLQILTFPIIIEPIPGPTAVPALQKFNPLACTGGRIVQANGSDINTFCQSTIYRTNRARRLIADSSSEIRNEKMIFSVYPNPAINQFNIRFKEQVVVKDVVLLNNLGQIVWNKTYNNSFQILNIRTNNFPTGNYLLKITTDKEILTKKVLIKQN